MKSRNTVWSALFVFVGAFLFASPARADAGTPLMWADMFHLAFGNVFIGVLEAHVITRAFRLKRRPVDLMIAANYFSALVGAAALTYAGLGPLGIGRSMEWINIYNARIVVVLLWAASFFLSVLLEWPFTYRIFKGHDLRLRSSFRASVVAQVASYAILLPFFAVLCSMHFYQDFRVEHSCSFASGMRGTVYYHSRKDGNVWKIRPGDAAPRIAFQTDDRNGILCFEPQDDDHPDRMDLCLVSQRKVKRVLIHSAIMVEKEAFRRSHGHLPSYMAGLDLRPAADRKLRILGDLFPRGLSIVEGSRVYWLGSFETPVLNWSSLYPNVVRGDYVVYSLGPQILVLDMKTRKVGLLAMGRYPVVVPDKDSMR